MGSATPEPAGRRSLPRRAVEAVVGPMTWANGRAWLKIIVLVLILRWLWVEPFTIPSASMEPTLNGDTNYFLADKVAVNKWVFGPRVPFGRDRLWDGGEPRRWDIVVFNHPDPDAENQVLIKRVVGLPGEWVQIRDDGRVYVSETGGDPWKALEPPEELRGRLHYTRGVLPSADDVNRFLAVRPEASDAPREQVREAIAQQYEGLYGVYDTEPYAHVPEDAYFLLGDNSPNSGDGRYFGWVPRENLVGRAFAVFWPPTRLSDLTGWTRTWWGLPIAWGIPLLIVLYELVTASIVLPWRVPKDEDAGPWEPGRRLYIDRRAYGLRVPLASVRLMSGRAPERGEWVAYAGAGGSVKLGRVEGLPGDPMREGAAEDGAPAADEVGRGEVLLWRGEASPPVAVARRRVLGPVRETLWGQAGRAMGEQG